MAVESTEFHRRTAGPHGTVYVGPGAPHADLNRQQRDRVRAALTVGIGLHLDPFPGVSTEGIPSCRLDLLVALEVMAQSGWIVPAGAWALGELGLDGRVSYGDLVIGQHAWPINHLRELSSVLGGRFLLGAAR
jgi:hypothetical protein